MHHYLGIKGKPDNHQHLHTQSGLPMVGAHSVLLDVFGFFHVIKKLYYRSATFSFKAGDCIF